MNNSHLSKLGYDDSDSKHLHPVVANVCNQYMHILTKISPVDIENFDSKNSTPNSPLWFWSKIKVRIFLFEYLYWKITNREYIIKDGDTALGLCLKFNVSMQQLLGNNDDNISPGKVSKAHYNFIFTNILKRIIVPALGSEEKINSILPSRRYYLRFKEGYLKVKFGVNFFSNCFCILSDQCLIINSPTKLAPSSSCDIFSSTNNSCDINFFDIKNRPMAIQSVSWHAHAHTFISPY